MPTYEYVCRSCGEQLEVVQAFTDDALETCPACGGSLRKVFGNVGIVFKGTGFYKTDSRQPSTAKGGGSSSGGGEGSGKTSGGDAAPAADSSAPATPAKGAESPAGTPASSSSPTPPAKPVAATT